MFHSDLPDLDLFAPPNKTLSRCFTNLFDSRTTTIFYLLMIVTCLSSIVLNCLVEPNTSAQVFLTFLELIINLLIISEVLIKVEFSSSESCSAGLFVDICVLILSIGSSIILLHQDLLDLVGEATCDSLFIFRSVVYILRVLFKKQRGKKSGLTELSIRLYRENEEMIRRKFEMAKIRYKYRPSMAVLVEEDEEESDGDGIALKTW